MISHFHAPVDNGKRRFSTALMSRAVVTDEHYLKTLFAPKKTMKTVAVISIQLNREPSTEISHRDGQECKKVKSLAGFENPELLKATSGGESFTQFDYGPDNTNRLLNELWILAFPIAKKNIL